MDQANHVINMCTGWCLPLYLQLSILAFQVLYAYLFFPVNTPGGKNRVILKMLLVGLLFAIIIYYLCQGCHNWAAWVVFFIPIVFGIITMIWLLRTISNINDVLRHLKMNTIN